MSSSVMKVIGTHGRWSSVSPSARVSMVRRLPPRLLPDCEEQALWECSHWIQHTQLAGCPAFAINASSTTADQTSKTGDVEAVVSSSSTACLAIDVQAFGTSSAVKFDTQLSVDHPGKQKGGRVVPAL